MRTSLSSACWASTQVERACARLSAGEPTVEWCRAQLARHHTTHQHIARAGTTMAGTGEAARAAADGLIEAAEATHNPWALANALYTYGYAFGDADPARSKPCARAR